VNSTPTADDNTPLLVIGSKNYSSWSLRPWLFLRKVGFDFKEHVIQFDAPDYQAQIARFSPSRRVPLLIDRQVKIWDSLAICEYAAERTLRGMPKDLQARAQARSVAAEMHSGFQTLREQCPMNIRATGHRVPLTPRLEEDIVRIDEIWSECRTQYGRGGGWLFGEFCIADALFAPVAFRFQTYAVQLSATARSYVQHALADPGMREWQEAALQEDHPLADVDRIGT
jgi:glutathione S-transferase